MCVCVCSAVREGLPGGGQEVCGENEDCFGPQDLRSSLPAATYLPRALPGLCIAGANLLTLTLHSCPPFLLFFHQYSFIHQSINQC